MTTADSEASDEAQIRALIEDRVEAVRAGDVNRAISSIAPDILTFDVVNPLQSVGSEATRKRAETWFSSFQGPIGYEIRDLSIATDDDIAFSHSLNRYSGRRQGEWKSTCGCARPLATVKSAASGWSSTSISLCPLMVRAAKPRSISRRSTSWLCGAVAMAISY
jgi:ketosteroid isomerase-like protein